MKTACASSLVVSVLILSSRELIETCLLHSSLFSGEKKLMKGCLPEQDVLVPLMHVAIRYQESLYLPLFSHCDKRFD